MVDEKGKADPENSPSIPDLPLEEAATVNDIVSSVSVAITIEQALAIQPSETRSKYSSSKWKQQRATAWTPEINSRTLGLVFFPIGIVLIALGIYQLNIKKVYNTVSYDYTDCRPWKGSPLFCHEIIQKSSPTRDCNCPDEVVQLPSDMSGKVTLSYELTNFFKNQRSYITSRDNYQLQGHLFENGKVRKPAEECAPFDYVGKKIVYPCGKLANSLFTDDIFIQNNLDETIPFTKFPAWVSDKSFKFGQPEISYNDSKFTDNFIKPPDWSVRTWQRFWREGGVTGDDFVSWMRTAAFTGFQNAFRIFEGTVSTCPEGFTGLCKGAYKLNITYRFETASFNGRKKVVISSDDFLNDQNYFIIKAYLIVGGIIFIFGLIFLLNTYLCKRIHDFLYNYSAKVGPNYSYERRDKSVENLVRAEEDVNNPHIGNQERNPEKQPQ